jgi:hypothetical protein
MRIHTNEITWQGVTLEVTAYCGARPLGPHVPRVLETSATGGEEDARYLGPRCRQPAITKISLRRSKRKAEEFFSVHGETGLPLT